MSRSRGFAAIALVALAAFVKLVACSGTALKKAGEGCNASSECGTGLVCDFGRDPHVCASTSTQETPDAPVIDAMPDAAIDGRPDARPDAPVDAPPDAPIDTIDAT